ncbi:MAG: DUF1385 domain-containing protein [Ruminococcaceae bacterium]|nr:DUF1385 domain-containing protein [Oscillospiraceae bacterium]
MSKNNNESCRLGTVGGQAVLEGVMMKSKDLVALSVRSTDGDIKTEVSKFYSVRNKHKILNIPILRGIVNFVETMLLSFKTLSRSADLLGIEEEETKFEKWLAKTFGKSVTAVASAIGMVLGLLLAVVLFIYLPILVSKLIENFLTDNKIILSVSEGLIKILIFVLYILLCTLIPDMKRTFQYHGAEHKSIFCHEAGLDLTVENVKKQSRFHPRCGTSFLFVMMFLGIITSALIIDFNTYVRVALKILFLPLVVGVGFEFIKFAGTHNNIFIKIISAPGLWIQRLTTKEPDEKQIEVAIVSLKASLPEIYPSEPVDENSNEARTETSAENGNTNSNE